MAPKLSPTEWDEDGDGNALYCNGYNLLDDYRGPFKLPHPDATVGWEDRLYIKRTYGCSVAVRWRKEWGARKLVVVGPPSLVDEAVVATMDILIASVAEEMLPTEPARLDPPAKRSRSPEHQTAKCLEDRRTPERVDPPPGPPPAKRRRYGERFGPPAGCHRILMAATGTAGMFDPPAKRVIAGRFDPPAKRFKEEPVDEPAKGTVVIVCSFGYSM